MQHVFDHGECQLNIVRLKNLIYNWFQQLDNIVQKIRLKSNEKILLVLKNHMKKHRKLLDFLKKEQNVELFFFDSVLVFIRWFYLYNFMKIHVLIRSTSQEDKFVIYACLRSGNNCYMVSNDTFKFSYQIQKSANLFRHWMFNRRIEFDTSKSELLVNFKTQY